MSRWTWWRTTRTTGTTQTAGRLRTTRCPLGAPMLQSYLDGELDAPAAARVRTHVAECHRCARELAVYQRISEALAARATIDEAVLDRLRDFAESLAERESREPGTEGAPQEPIPGTETVPPEAVPNETMPNHAMPAEAMPTETVPGTAPRADRDAEQGAVHKAGG
ncbi:anti-sigma factor family protein [Streptomyces rugosispiralis]|uniref:Zf-HC2 domain-containing protein n=1 Tax=Streptomyces rugosispiralis TaxID=2967341 RepID=A0ABT1V0L9_9ACTN|nr:zf-HC2 domain-containing protein [Streptomyces rugosispiralis]MCQ8190928.1 zf-HC2 domain-containing protein [Streptomyces rugosispiralis]